MNDEQMQPLLEVWLHDRDEAPRDPNGGIARVTVRLPEVRQRGRWWPLPAFQRNPKAPTATDATDYQPSPVPATNGHATIVIGRTQTMLSPVKAITAGALVFAIGGVLLIAQPFDQRGSVPGAEQGAELAPPVVVTITESDGTDEPEVCTGDAPAICTWGGSDQWSATDPRLSGTATLRATEYFWEGPPGGSTEAYAIEVVNDKGVWVGTGRATVAREFGGLNMYTLNGEGAYEGLSAVLTQPDDNIIKAVIIDGGLPPFPELPAE